MGDAVVILAASSMSTHNRARLIAQGIPFAVPGNQLYIPELAMDLREHFRAPKPSRGDGFSPAAQAVLFHYLLRRGESATTPSAIAECLRYSAMSIGRAFDALAAVGLAKTERHGKERHLQIVHDRHALMEKARPLLRTPVRAVKHVKPHGRLPNLKLAGESALAELTDLTHPKGETYAVAAHGWKTLAENLQLENVSEHEDGCTIETWSHDPAGLSDGPIVDPLSLYAQFRDHHDERIVMAAERLMESAICSGPQPPRRASPRRSV